MPVSARRDLYSLSQGPLGICRRTPKQTVAGAFKVPLTTKWKEQDAFSWARVREQGNSHPGVKPPSPRREMEGNDVAAAIKGGSETELAAAMDVLALQLRDPSQRAANAPLASLLAQRLQRSVAAGLATRLLSAEMWLPCRR